MTDSSSSSPGSDRLDRYLAGELTPDERAHLERQLHEASDQSAIIAAVRADTRMFEEHFVPDESRMWAQVMASTGIAQDSAGYTGAAVAEFSNGHKIPQTSPGDVLSTSALAQRPGRWRTYNPASRPVWYGISAIALAALVLVINNPFARVNSHPGSVTPVSIYSTGQGERATITLPDGSKVMLNVASRLEVPVDYLNGNRTLRLHGEALFSVIPNPNTPFTVAAGAAAVQVLGTRFSVRAYATDRSATVAVRDGKISVHGTVLTAAQQVEVTPAGVSQITKARDAHFAFSEGVLVLEGQPLSELVADLNRWYNVDLRFGDPEIARQHWEAKLEAGSPADLTTMLEVTFGARVVRQGRTLTLYSRQGR